MSDRTPQEREAARLERERRRAAREGRPLPPDPPPAATGEQPPSEPPATEQHDVTVGWTGEHPVPELPPTELHDVTIAWEGERLLTEPLAPEPEPEPTPEHEHGNGTGEHPAAAPAAAEPEVPLGTRRVTAQERHAAQAPKRRRRGRRPSSTGSPRDAAADAASRPRRRLRGRVVAVLALALVALAGWFLLSLFQPFAGEGSGRVVVRIPKGASASAIGDVLARERVVSSSFFFGLRARIEGDRGNLRSGTFTLRHDMSYGAALHALTTAPAPPPVTKVTIPEGLSRREAAPIVRSDGLRGSYAAATRAATGLDPHAYGAPKHASLEGFLFPATYQLRPHAGVQALVAAQLAAFKQNLATVSLRHARAKNLTAYDVLIIASMVEREVSVAKERPLVAAVIWNRLHQHIPLGIDATLRFALHDWTHPLRVSQLASSTPYNTRNHQGLPPGPIGNPGLASLQAAAHPAHVPYLFYVVKPGTCGQHTFSSTDAQFQRDVARYNRARDAAGGKSPEKC
jgi:UPF0755 protein